MGIRLGRNNYGKSRVRLLRATRYDNGHDIKELTLAISFEGEFDDGSHQGRQQQSTPDRHDQKYRLRACSQASDDQRRGFSLSLIEHFLSHNQVVARVRVEAVEDLWTRIPLGGKPAALAFVRAGEEKRTASLDGSRQGVEIRAGVANLVVMKTSDSAFDGFLRDSYTTLPEVRDRILATSIRANWLYERGPIEFDDTWEKVKSTLLEAFAEHKSESLQHTLYAMGEAAMGNIATHEQLRRVSEAISA